MTIFCLSVNFILTSLILFSLYKKGYIEMKQWEIWRVDLEKFPT